jgi:hypothetical protein
MRRPPGNLELSFHGNGSRRHTTEVIRNHLAQLD